MCRRLSSRFLPDRAAPPGDRPCASPGGGCDRARSPDEGGWIILGAIIILAMTFLSVGAAVTVVSRSMNADLAEETSEEIDRLSSALLAYYEDVGAYPAALGDLVVKPAGVVGWLGPYMKHTFEDEEARSLDALHDAWGTAYQYSSPSVLVGSVKSLGANRVDDGGIGDDLISETDANAVSWATTRHELRILRAAIAAYNFVPTSPDSLPPVWATAIPVLQGSGFLPAGPATEARFLSDGWGQTYVPEGAPMILTVKSLGPPE